MSRAHETTKRDPRPAIDGSHRPARSDSPDPVQTGCRSTKVAPLILVVDDNEAGLLLVCSVLELDGFRVESAGSQEELMKRLSAGVPDLILMDIQLAGQDGLAVTRQLKADPGFASIPIVALTARAMVGDRKQAIAAGCSGYISKPIDTRILGDQVRAFLALEPQGSGAHRA
jgi:CheY-like chemotaxis protein